MKNKSFYNWFHPFLIILLLFAGLFSGCALFNPHVGPSVAVVGNQISTNYASPDYTVREAVQYGYEMYQSYYNAVQAHSELNSSSGIIMTGLAGAAAAGGVARIPTLTSLGLGAGAGAVYAGSTFLHSGARQYVYLAGMDAIICSINVSLPFNMTDADIKTLTNAEAINLSDINTAIFNAGNSRVLLAGNLASATLLTNEVALAISNLDEVSSKWNLLNKDVSEMGAYIKAVGESPDTNVSSQTNSPIFSSWEEVLKAGRNILSQSSKASLIPVKSRLQFYQNGSQIRAGNYLLQQLDYNLNLSSNVTAGSTKIISDASKLYGRYQMAGKNLFQKINQVRDEVSRQILRTEPNLSAFATQLGLTMPRLLNTSGTEPSTATPQVSTPASTNSPTDPKAVPDPDGIPDAKTNILNTLLMLSSNDVVRVANDASNLTSKLTGLLNSIEKTDDRVTEYIHQFAYAFDLAKAHNKELADQYIKIQSDLNRVNYLVARINEQIGSMTLQDCIVSNEPENISIFPPSPIIVQTNATVLIRVTGGKPPYVVNWPVATETNAFTTSTQILGGGPRDQKNSFVISLTATTNVPGSHVFLINDLDGSEKSVVIQMK
jgi:hypothetical protein